MHDLIMTREKDLKPLERRCKQWIRMGRSKDSLDSWLHMEQLLDQFLPVVAYATDKPLRDEKDKLSYGKQI